MVTAWIGFLLIGAVSCQQQCYFSAGAQYRGPSELVPCNGTGVSACCLLGDTCLSGNTCYNYATGNLYQYGCTDINYQDESCPYKCGLDPNKSPWIALEYCNDVPDLSNNWVCHSPDSCGCDWKSTYGLLVLQPRGCSAMGSDALVGLYAPDKLAPYVSLPPSAGGSTGYYSPTVSDGSSTWVETAIPGYTPTPFTQLTTYRAAPTTPVQIDPSATPGPSTYSAAASYTAPASRPTSSDDNTATTSPATTIPASSTASLATHTATAETGLSTGAKIGIGVGAGVGFCLIVGLTVALVLLRRRKNKQQAHPPAPSYPGTPHMQQQPGPYPQQWTPQFAQGQPQEPFYGYQQELSPRKERAPSYKSSSQHPVPSPPMELSADAARQPVHEIDSQTRVGSPGRDGRMPNFGEGDRF